MVEYVDITGKINSAAYGVAFFWGGDPPEPCDDCPSSNGFIAIIMYGDEPISVNVDAWSRREKLWESAELFRIYLNFEN